MHSLVAATSDTIRIWDLGVSSTAHSLDGVQQHSYRRPHSSSGSSSGTGSGIERACIETNAVYRAEKPADAIDSITSVSWAVDGSTFVVGGRGTCIRQYGRAGESLQDIKLHHKTERPGVMNVTAVKHYGGTTEGLFVANATAKQVRRWDFVRKEYVATCQTHENAISCMAVCAKKRLVASATAQGGEIGLFNLLHNTRSDLRSATHKSITCIDISAGHRSQVSVGSEDGLLQLFDASRSGNAPLRSFSHLHSAPLRGLAFHPSNSSTLITAGLDKRVIVTDASSYTTGSSPGRALEISAKSPLTCLSCTPDPVVIGVGTIDGDVLVYDARMAAVPLWSATVRPNHAIVSMDITVAREHGQGLAASQPLGRSSSQREARITSRLGTRAGYNSSDDGASSLPPDRRRVRGSVAAVGTDNTRQREDRSAASAASAAHKRSDAGHRPPQHPNIARFRAALNEHRQQFGTKSASRVTEVSPPEDCRYQDEPSIAARDSPGNTPSNAEVEDMALLAKDRSYMDLLSPAKPDHRTLATANPSLAATKQPDLLSLLSNKRESVPSQTASRLELPEQRHNGRNAVSVQAYEPRAATVAAPAYAPESDRIDINLSPLSRPLNPRSGRHEQPQTHDAGDSIMEMFTPERKHRSTNAAALNKDSPAGIAQNLVTQLLEKQASTKTKPQSTGEPVSTGRNTAVKLKPVEDQPASRSRISVRDDGGSLARVATATATAAATANPASPPTTTRPSAAREPAVTPTAKPISQPPDAVVASGLGPVSNHVLQNAIADAIAPLCEQIRGEVRNLHLDLIRQGFVYQEQIKALRQECGESRALRLEIDQLRRENEQLRRYVPFFELPSQNARSEHGRNA